MRTSSNDDKVNVYTVITFGEYKRKLVHGVQIFKQPRKRYSAGFYKEQVLTSACCDNRGSLVTSP